MGSNKVRVAPVVLPSLVFLRWSIEPDKKWVTTISVMWESTPHAKLSTLQVREHIFTSGFLDDKMAECHDCCRQFIRPIRNTKGPQELLYGSWNVMGLHQVNCWQKAVRFLIQAVRRAFSDTVFRRCLINLDQKPIRYLKCWQETRVKHVRVTFALDWRKGTHLQCQFHSALHCLGTAEKNIPFFSTLWDPMLSTGMPLRSLLLPTLDQCQQASWQHILSCQL